MAIKYKNILTYLWLIYLFLIVISLLEVASASVDIGIKSGSFIKPGIIHGSYIILGFLSMLFIIKSKDKFINLTYKFAEGAMIMTIVLLFFTLIMGIDANQARRSINLPVINKSINTFEVFKLVVVIYLAKILTHNRKHQEIFKKNVYKGLILTGIGIAIVFTQNLSTAIIISSVAIMMVLMAKLPKDMLRKIINYSAIAVIIGILGIFISKINRSSTWKSRVEKFITGEYSINDQGYLTQAAVAHTPLLHLGPGKSNFKYILPLSYTDYIYAITAEELPPLAIIIPGAYLLLLYFSILIVIKQKKPYYMLIVAGYSLMITIQAFIHIMVNLNLLPETGQPLPFISKGGTAIIINSIMLGIIMSIHKISASKTPKNKEPDIQEPEDFDIEEIDSQYYIIHN